MVSIREAKSIEKDVTVVGGGLAGVCAAIAAAREGAKVALVHNRPVPGGNSSSETRVWTVGATAMGNNRYAAESGIIGELDLENLYRNPEGNPHLWDALLMDVIKREENLELFLNTEVQEVRTTEGKIESATAYQSGTEKKYAFKSRLYIDCTGDGSLGYWAGALFTQGKEGRNDFDEDMAPEKAEPYTLGSTLLFYVKDTGKPVNFVPPDCAYPIPYIEDLFRRTKKSMNINDSGCDLWWIEYGGIFDTIQDNESIRDELHRLIYGIWNYVKNSGKYKAGNLTLEWVGSIPAKRESRRFVGEIVLTQNHILSHQNFEDTVCCGGWPIDVHPEQGIYSESTSCSQRPAGIYQIPLGSLYSKNIKNLMFAGRNISATHLAFASTRVMKTCACTGQAAGAAAAIAVQSEKYPFELACNDVKRIQQVLTREDLWLYGVENPDISDIADQAVVTASGVRKYSSETVFDKLLLNEDLYILMPALKCLQELKLKMEGEAGQPVQIEGYLVDARKGYHDMSSIGVFKSTYTGAMDWIRFPCNVSLDGSRHVLVKIPRQKNAYIGVAKESCCGVTGSIGSLTSLKLFHPCFKIDPEPQYFSPKNVINGVTRPEKHPNIWVSNPMNGCNAWIELAFEEIRAFSQIQILFNPDFNRDYNHLKPDYYGNGWDQMPPELVKGFLLQARQPEGGFVEIANVENQINRRFTLKTDLKTDCIRVEFVETYGSMYAQVFGIKVYP